MTKFYHSLLLGITLTLVLLSMPLIGAVVGVANESILSLLHITPSELSKDYVINKKQFQLQSLVTEQRHPKTYNLSYQLKNDTQKGLESLSTVDEDISQKFKQMANDPIQLKKLNEASTAIKNALLDGRTVYIYGTGATGRLAKQVESALWRPFWAKVRQKPFWNKINSRTPGIETRMIGEMTGGDRALVSSLEGFEDLQLIGKLQLQSHNIKKGDVIFAITEGGETSAVIGTILAGAQLNKGSKEKNLYFIYNNPDLKLQPFERSNAVLKNSAVVKINLTTGPQAITGSTRMQATTSELFLVGIVFEDALYHVLKKSLTNKELDELGFDSSLTLKKRLLSFADLQKAVYQTAPQTKLWTDLEAQTYEGAHSTFYVAKRALLQVFTDITERAPTFSLSPLDTTQDRKKMSLVQVGTPVNNQKMAWDALLYRPFSGLDPNFYEPHFKNEIPDPYLKETALRSLKKAGDDQQYLYDFSLSDSNIQKSGLQADDLAILVLLPGESDRDFSLWQSLLSKSKARSVYVLVTENRLDQTQLDDLKKHHAQSLFVNLVLPSQGPLGLNQQIGLKMMLNAHSTAVMAKLGRVVGNTMTYVHPSNLKLIGRATYLIQVHVNDVLKRPDWIAHYGTHTPISYAEINAVLFDGINYSSTKKERVSEVALSIVRILESMKCNHAISWDDADKILHQQTLADYLHHSMPVLSCPSRS